MPTITTVPQRETSIPVLSSPKDGYTPLSHNHYDFCFDDPKQVEYTQQETDSKSSFTTFVHFLHNCVIAVLQPLCFRTADSVDGDKFFIAEYHKSECWEKNVHEPVEEFEETHLLCDDHLWEQSTCCSDKVFYKLSCELPLPKKKLDNETSVTQLIKESQIRSQLLANNGKDQLLKSKECVTKSRQQLEEVKTDIFAIRNDIRTAKRLFQEVECGLRDCKWEENKKKYARNTCVCPVTTLLIPNSYEKMYREHRIFLEEMKYHFRWQHGIEIL